MSAGLIDIIGNVRKLIGQDTFQDVVYTFDADNENARRLLQKYKIASALFWLYVFTIVVVHILMTAITIKILPTYKILHGIMYFLLGLFWLCPVLIYYVLSNDYVLGKALYPTTSGTGYTNNVSNKLRRL